MHGEEAPQSKEAQLQAALDAEREKVKRLSTCGTDHSTPWWQVKCEDLEAQLATLQARCAHLDVLLRDEYLPKLDVVAVRRSIADRDSRIDALEREVEKLDDDKETLQAQLRQVEGERDQWIAANTKEPINEPVTYQALAGARFHKAYIFE
jgi:predicted RNase H-like nuclease (RuvC/YqgF family)